MRRATLFQSRMLLPRLVDSVVALVSRINILAAVVLSLSFIEVQRGQHGPGTGSSDTTADSLTQAVCMQLPISCYASVSQKGLESNILRCPCTRTPMRNSHLFVGAFFASFSSLKSTLSTMTIPLVHLRALHIVHVYEYRDTDRF